MKKVFATAMLTLSSMAFANDFRPELFDAEGVDQIVSGDVVVNEESMPGTEVAKALYVDARVYEAQDTGSWSHFSSMKALEDHLGSQAPFHVASFKKIKELDDPAYWLYESDSKNSEYNRFSYVVDNNKVHVVYYWRDVDYDESSQNRLGFSQSENRYDLPSALKQTVDKALSDPSKQHFGASGYQQNQAMYIALNEPFASEISSEYEESGEPGPSFSAPYVWGHYYMGDEFQINNMYQANIERFQAPFRYEDFDLSFYQTIEDFEDYVGAEVPIRAMHSNWLKEIGQEFYILHARYKEGKIFGYNDFLHFHTVKDHKPFMTILLNSDDYYRE